MNESSFISFFTYMLRQNVIPFWKELFVALKWHQTFRSPHYIARVTDLYIKAIPVYRSYSEANYNARFGTCVDIVSYLCKFWTKWHQILDTSLSNNPKLACLEKRIFNPVSIPSKQVRL